MLIFKLNFFYWLYENLWIMGIDLFYLFNKRILIFNFVIIVLNRCYFWLVWYYKMFKVCIIVLYLLKLVIIII